MELNAEMIVDGRVPSAPRISPDGRRVAFVVVPASRVGERVSGEIHVVPTDGSAPARRVVSGGAEHHSLGFSYGGEWLYFLSDRDRRGVFQLYRLPLTRPGEAEALTDRAPGLEGFAPLPGDRAVGLLDKDGPTEEDERRRREGDDARVVGERWSCTRLRLLNLDSGEIRNVDLGERHVAEVAPEPAGERLAVITWPTPELDNFGRNNGLHVVDVASGEARSVCGLGSGGYSPVWAGGRVLFLSGLTGTTIHGVGPDETEPTPKPLAGGAASCPEQLVGRGDGRPLAVLAEGLDTTLEEAKPDGDHNRLSRHPGSLQSVSASTDGRVISALRGTPETPSEVWSGPPAGPLVRITDSRPALEEVAWGAQERLSWVAPDGLEIDGLLVLPPGKERRDGPFPLVTIAHGGPYARYADSFHLHWCLSGRWLAAGGYAVLLPNPRGGQGRGRGFATRLDGNVGVGDYPDVEAGIDALVSEGVADPDRLGIGGWSHGGFLAAWAVGQTDRFKAAIMGAGMSDLGSLIAEHDFWHETAVEVGHTGWEGPGPHRHDELSPASYAHRIKTPVLILHGEKDTRVPLNQASYFAKGLSEHGCPHEFVVYPREGHAIEERGHQLDVLRRTRTWFDRWLGPEA